MASYSGTVLKYNIVIRQKNLHPVCLVIIREGKFNCKLNSIQTFQPIVLYTECSVVMFIIMGMYINLITNGKKQNINFYLDVCVQRLKTER